MPAAVNCLIKPSGTRSGASVTSIAPLRGRVSVFKSSAVGARKARGSCTPGFSGDRNGPSRWMPSTLGSRSTSIATAAIASLVLSGVSLMKVGRKPVVPNLRCAAAIAVMLAGVGASLNSTSPPPLTCRSMKPGASQAPSGSVRTVMAGGKSDRGTMPATCPSSITTAASRCTTMPSKTWSAATACRDDVFIGCA